MLTATDLVWRAGPAGSRPYVGRPFVGRPFVGRPIVGRPIVNQVSLQVARGETLGIVGPNGCGKSTLLRLLYRVLTPTQGQVHLHGQDIWRLDARQFARQVAVMGQSPPALEGRVHDAVMMGRYPHQSRWSHDSARDRAIVHDCLQQVSANHLANATLASLSGGERQRVLLARALAQEPELLFLDEPTNHLDIRYQLELMALITRLQRTVVVVLHDLNLAAAHCDRIALLQGGRIAAIGPPAEVFTPAHIGRVFGVRAQVETDAQGKLRISYAL
ncbi:hypothetical protein CCO03_16060 [Comamonas serinivorans]|uniref:ABC transporter domain-containing protein n=1 Tax=Comamonas serinivorans TaxID=1082851 RepID=A0A1Y0ERD2_9BURK|nr:ABC transporter ATP-binding protein [Comamonas serinivorans]ARU05980.1 hypothetical protein CCO03_16060 [Comamonas serinivorans]